MTTNYSPMVDGKFVGSQKSQEKRITGVRRVYELFVAEGETQITRIPW